MFLCIENWKSRQVKQQEPWDYVLEAKNKADFTKQLSDGNTKHCCYSVYEGITPTIRIAGENNVYKMYGLLVDFDHAATDSDIETALSEVQIQPTYYSRSFSGNVHCVWMFENPITVFNTDVFKKVVGKLKQKLKLTKILPCFDERVFVDPKIYFEAGYDWKQTESVISESFVLSVLMEALERSSFKDTGLPEIPLDIVEAAVHDRFPGRWPGEFKEGARGPRFWDVDADAPGAAIVKPQGMVCYTGPTAFMSWERIFGPDFVRDHVENRLGNAVKDVFWDAQWYWRLNPFSNHYDRLSKEDLSLQIECDYSLKPIYEGTTSEVRRVLRKIQEIGRIDGAAPFVCRPTGPIEFQGKRYLNIANTNTLRPCESPEAQPEDFPWLNNLLSNFFDPCEQLDYFLAWLKVFYESQLYKRPVTGHVLFLAGEVNQGKTLLSNKIISSIFGSNQDASSFLTAETNFNKELFFSPLWTMDDTLPVADNRRRSTYSNLIKKMAANRLFEYHPKFENATMVEWAGRIIVTCNLDPESIRIIPNLDTSMEEKISAFRIATTTPELRGFNQDIDSTVERELPYFCRWLLNWEIPEHVLGDPRYKIKNYVQKELEESSDASSETTQFKELIYLFAENFFNNHDKIDVWQGTVMKMYTEMNEDPYVRSAVNKYTPDVLGRKLTKLNALPWLEYGYDKVRGREWKIHRSILSRD